MIRNKQILVAVLNWGLGHATRCIPIIRQLIADENKVTMASDGAALALLSSSFPELPTLTLPGYNVTYPSQSMVWNIGSQLPKIAKAIRSEKKILDNWNKKNKVDVIISDNRYGCHHNTTENILISHQLNLQVPFGSTINRLHAKMINKFNQVWIVDDEHRTLSGRLSDPKWLSDDLSIKFIGPQSRLKKVTRTRKYDIAAVLSGPEPQRTLLEKELCDKLAKLNLKSILVQGTKRGLKIKSSDNLEIIPFAEADLLSEIICGSELLICRSGYSTLMDLAKLGGRALFIPTPGQTEQIYLAERLKDQRLAHHQKQGQLDIQKAWNGRNEFSGF